MTPEAERYGAAHAAVRPADAGEVPALSGARAGVRRRGGGELADAPAHPAGGTTALPSIDEQRWVPLVQETDVLLLAGGDALYLSHWMRQSGLAKLMPSLDNTVWVGLSAGSMVMTPTIGEDFVGWKPPTGGDSTLGIVDFSIFPHVDHPDLPENTMAAAERWAAGLSGPAYAIDDETAIKVTDGAVELVSEGHWKLFTPSPAASEAN
jgi:dipeptidase E